jgi:hypothetical protein
MRIIFGDRKEVWIKVLRLPVPQNKFKNLSLGVYTDSNEGL